MVIEGEFHLHLKFDLHHSEDCSYHQRKEAEQSVDWRVREKMSEYLNQITFEREESM